MSAGETLMGGPEAIITFVQAILSSVDRDSLIVELARLRKGRGLTRPHLSASLGPSLREALDIGDDTLDEDVRTRLTTLITDECATFPQDLRDLVQAAYGISSNRPLLQDRLTLAGERLRRDQRTLRRRLVAADDLMADRILLRYGGRRGLVRPGWNWATYRMEVDVSRPQPSMTSRRVLVPSLDGLDAFEEIVSIPQVGGTDDWRVECLDGCTYEGRESLSGSSWRLRYALPHQLPAGEPFPTAVRLTWPSKDWIQPVAAFIPTRPVERFEVSVSFGLPRACSSAWVLNGVLPTAYADAPSPDSLVADHTVEVGFSDLVMGLIYGVAWTWA